ncbi:MAG: tRNA (N6-threonylcarbamoyladenosine(37)-N6)-methyltransferase TrmO [Candidatus Hydrothermarchaeales archaeon]
MEIEPIGVIKSTYKTRRDAPRQGTESEEVSKIILYDDFAEILEEIKGQESLIILYWMHLADRKILSAESKRRGVFATRSPERPNPIGFSVVKVLKTGGNEVDVKYLDAVDGTPVIDIRPYSNG